MNISNSLSALESYKESIAGNMNNIQDNIAHSSDNYDGVYILLLSMLVLAAGTMIAYICKICGCDRTRVGETNLINAQADSLEININLYQPLLDNDALQQTYETISETCGFPRFLPNYTDVAHDTAPLIRKTNQKKMKQQQALIPLRSSTQTRPLNCLLNALLTNVLLQQLMKTLENSQQQKTLIYLEIQHRAAALTM